MEIEVHPVPHERVAELLGPINSAFGVVLNPERLDRVSGFPELDGRFGAVEGGAVVGSACSFTFDMTVPGGAAVETAGLTLVGVLPTHRRRGVLRALMRRYLDEAHRRGQVISGLFASEAAIYGRFGYGMAALAAEVGIDRRRADFALPAPTGARVRLLGEAEAAAAFPPIWDRARAVTPGMLSRSRDWWRARRLSDPESLRAGRGPLERVLVEIDGRPAAYALYRFAAPATPWGAPTMLDVAEAIGDSPDATRAIWRYLLDVDLVSFVRASLLPVDHPLVLLLREPRRLQMRIGDGIWMRLVDVGAALARRSFGPGGAVVLGVVDGFCPWNEGRYRVGDGEVERTAAAADLTMSVDALGAAYLGGIGFTQLAQAGRVVELRAGALRRAELLFRGDRMPWCPENF